MSAKPAPLTLKRLQQELRESTRLSIAAQDAQIEVMQALETEVHQLMSRIGWLETRALRHRSVLDGTFLQRLRWLLTGR